MAMRGSVRAVAAPGTAEGPLQGAQAVSSVPMFLLLQHSLIDQADNSVLAYRRLVSHIEFEGPLAVQALKGQPDKFKREIAEAGEMMRRFRARKNPFGTEAHFSKVNGPENLYEVWIGGRPHKFVHGDALAAAIEAVSTPYREWEFEDASIPVSEIHSECHAYLAMVKLMQFDSAYSNAAESFGKNDMEKGEERILGLHNRRKLAEGDGETKENGSRRKPSGPSIGFAPDWADEE